MTDLTVDTPLGKGSFMLAGITTGVKKQFRYLVWVPLPIEDAKKYHLVRMDKKRALFAFTSEELGMED
jgi:hypothetical protein